MSTRTRLEPLPGERSSSRQTRWRRLTWVGVLAAASIRFLQPLHFSPDARALRSIIRGETARVGYYLYKEGDWANPYGPLRTGPTAHSAPVFPAIIAGLFHLFGTGAAGVYSAQVADSIALIAEVALLPLVAEALGADAGVALLAALLAVLGLAHCPGWEANYLGLLLLLSTLLACRFLNAVRPRGGLLSRTPPVLWACAAGLTWGIVLLTGPAAMPVLLAWILFGGWHSYHKRALKAFLPALVVPVIVISPWLLRNYRVLHSPVLKSNLGITLSMSNNPCAGFGDRVVVRSPCFRLLNPNGNLEETRRVRDLGEVAYNRLKFQEAEQWIRGNPQSFWRLTRERFLYFWFPADTGSFSDALLRGSNPVRAWVVYGTTLLSVPGLFLLWSTSRYGCTICATFLLFYPPVYYFVVFDPRYRFPITWVTLLLAGVTLSRGARWLEVLLGGGAVSTDRKVARASAGF